VCVSECVWLVVVLLVVVAYSKVRLVWSSRSSSRHVY